MANFPELTEIRRPDANIVCLYIEGFLFDDFHEWESSKWGKRILKTLGKRRYNNFLKCVYSDNEALTNEPTPNSIKSNNIECIMNWTYALHQSENVKCFTVCTIKFQIEHIPQGSMADKDCRDCHLSKCATCY